jgi:RNA polymerase sigma factor for flagellar operon FliA
MPIVRHQATKLSATLPDCFECDDLMSVGVFGLVQALKAFDPNRGVKFETYCVPRVRGAMLDELRHMDWVPRLVRSKAAKYNAAARALEVKHGREATVDEIAEHLALSVKEVEAMKIEATAVGVMSLDKKWFETESFKDVREIDVLDDRKAPHADANLAQMDELRKLTKGMNKAERIIIIGYYYERQTMKEIGEQLDLSESRVSQMHSQIIERLRVTLRPKAVTA